MTPPSNVPVVGWWRVEVLPVPLQLLLQSASCECYIGRSHVPIGAAGLARWIAQLWMKGAVQFENETMSSDGTSDIG